MWYSGPSMSHICCRRSAIDGSKALPNFSMKLDVLVRLPPLLLAFTLDDLALAAPAATLYCDSCRPIARTSYGPPWCGMNCSNASRSGAAFPMFHVPVKISKIRGDRSAMMTMMKRVGWSTFVGRLCHPQTNDRVEVE